jgi:hypothetical protein|tara:strand:- start:3640 stop:3900 length:261 start_codon:yes stop_codon:yes gene_type:complete
MILKERYFMLKNNYIIDLINVDFITFKENEKVAGEFWIKFHLGTKECRFRTDTKEQVTEIINTWAEIHGKELSLHETEIGGANEWA